MLFVFLKERRSAFKLLPLGFAFPRKHQPTAMQTPARIDARFLVDHFIKNPTPAPPASNTPPSVLSTADEAYVAELLDLLRSGKPAFLVVEESKDRLKYISSNAGRADLIAMLLRVIETQARKLSD